MSHSVMVPITTLLQAMAPVETAPLPEDGLAGPDFVIEEEQAPETAAAPPAGPPPADRHGDPLQRLVESLSGISSALPEKPAAHIAQHSDDALPARGDGVPADEEMPPRQSRPDLPPLGPEMAQSDVPPLAETGERPAPAPDGEVTRETTALPGQEPRPLTPLPADPVSPVAGHAPGQTPEKAIDRPVAARILDRAEPAAPPRRVMSAGARETSEASAPRIGPAERPGPDAPAPEMAGPDKTAAAPERVLADMAARSGEPAFLDPQPVQARSATGGGDVPDAQARPVPVARQIAEALVTTRNETIEIALAPEELGRLRMVVSGPDQAAHVTIWVERPEVLEQLRRNGAFLQECLGDAGMSGASFEFRGDTPSDPQDDRAGSSPDRRDTVAAILPAQIVPVSWTPLAVPARLDIRI